MHLGILSLGIWANLDFTDEEKYLLDEVLNPENYVAFDDDEYLSKCYKKFKKPKIEQIYSAICMKMDIASIIYHSPVECIEIYGLEDVKTFSYSQRQYQIDWRFVGYAIMKKNGCEDCDLRVFWLIRREITSFFDSFKYIFHLKM